MAPGDHCDAKITSINVSLFTIPTSSPESDGTYSWTKTTMVLLEVTAGNEYGLGYTYADASTAELIRTTLAPIVIGQRAMDVTACWQKMVAAIRNLGRAGICSMAISAVDTALWDLKAKLLGLPLCKLFGQVREKVAVYGSGGFTNYSEDQMRSQLEGWMKQGITRMKIKIGTHPQDDLARVRHVRETIGSDAELFVDANGAFDAKTALGFAERFADYGVSWFEEPVTSDDLDGLAFIRERAPAGMDIAAGEYGYDLDYFQRMLAAQAVDVLQADATRCGGFTGFLQADVLAAAHHRPLSAHCAPALHLHVCSAARQLRHIEYFHDHARVERMLFEGAMSVNNGCLAPDLSRPGIGLELKAADAARFAA
jgi:L-alanine-DL-glutamate epimerase-like enolase superfamily enzyme